MSVVPMTAPSLEDIHDIRPPLAIPDAWRWPLAIGLAVVAATAIVLLLRWYVKWRARPLTPRAQALRALAHAEVLAGQGRARDWADLVAETVRAALSVRLGRDVLPKTTTELRPALASTPAGSELLELLDTCDLARFARASLDGPALLERTAAARELVLPLFDPLPPPALPAATVTA